MNALFRSLFTLHSALVSALWTPLLTTLCTLLFTLATAVLLYAVHSYGSTVARRDAKCWIKASGVLHRDTYTRHMILYSVLIHVRHIQHTYIVYDTTYTHSSSLLIQHLASRRATVLPYDCTAYSSTAVARVKSRVQSVVRDRGVQSADTSAE
jgi:hypothetical protein